MTASDFHTPRKNFIHEIIDERLDRLTEQRIREFTRDHATDENGRTNDEMAFIIRREVQRRSTMGRELDIFEPARWAFSSFALSAVGSIGLKFLMGEHVNSSILKTIVATTALGSGIGLLRLTSRFEAGLRGGLDTAFSMRELEKARREKNANPYPLTL